MRRVVAVEADTPEIAKNFIKFILNITSNEVQFTLSETMLYKIGEVFNPPTPELKNTKSARLPEWFKGGSAKIRPSATKGNTEQIHRKQQTV